MDRPVSFYHATLCEEPQDGAVILAGAEPILRTAVEGDARRHTALALDIARRLHAFEPLKRLAEEVFARSASPGLRQQALIALKAAGIDPARAVSGGAFYLGDGEVRAAALAGAGRAR